MAFIVVLLFLLAVRYWWGELPSIAGSYPAKWFGWINSSLSGTAAYLASVVLPALLLAWVSNGFEAILFGLPAFMLHLGVLLFVLHAPSPEMTFDALQLQARQSTTEDGLLADTQGQTLRSLLSNLHQGFFIYIVWYLLLGPGGALFCFLQRHYERQEDNRTAVTDSLDGTATIGAQTVSRWLVGLSIRVSLLLLALVGRLRDGWPYFVASLKDWSIDEGDLLYAGVCIGLVPEVERETTVDSVTYLGWLQDYEGLISRLFFGWIGLAALLTLLS